MARHVDAIESKAATSARIDARSAGLPDDVAQLREQAAHTTQPEDAIAVNTAILRHAPDDSVALNRLGRAYEAIGSIAQAKETFQRAVEVDPDNRIATGRLRDLVRSQRR